MGFKYLAKMTIDQISGPNIVVYMCNWISDNHSIDYYAT